MWRKAGPGKAARFITGYSDATGVCAGALMAPPGVVATPKGGSGPAEPRATNRTQEGGGNCHAGSACDDLLPHALPSGPVMTVRNFDSLLNPASVALLGASPKTGSVGSIVAQNLRRGGFAGPIWFVNPKYRRLDDHPCYASVAALPAAPDLAVLATPPKTIPALIGELGAKGTRAAVVITAGIRGDLKQAMLDAARPYTLRVQGPNCVGLMLPRLGLNASFSFAAPAGDIAFLSQSGALITGIVDWARGRNIGFSHVDLAWRYG